MSAASILLRYVEKYGSAKAKKLLTQLMRELAKPPELSTYRDMTNGEVRIYWLASDYLEQKKGC